MRANPARRADLAALQLEILPFDEELAFLSAGLEVVAASRGLSLGDRACLATAQKLGLPALTADRNWRIPDLKIKLRFIRERPLAFASTVSHFAVWPIVCYPSIVPILHSVGGLWPFLRTVRTNEEIWLVNQANNINPPPSR